jgi:phage shock protein PspC (stress-responsive transcriptional regulator)
MTIFDVNTSYWIGMGILVALTTAYIIVCWAIPPKKKREHKREH